MTDMPSQPRYGFPNWPGRPVRYTCFRFTDWIWHLSSQRGWTPRPQHSLLRPRLSTLLTQASTPSARRWSRGQRGCNNSSNTSCSPVSMHLVVHLTLYVCAVVGSTSSSCCCTELQQQSRGPQCMLERISSPCTHTPFDCCRCIQMLAGLWNAPESGKTEGEQRLGTSTIGSSEACMLGGLALKRRWSVARKKAGKSTEKPNLILGINAQVSQPVLQQNTHGQRSLIRHCMLCLSFEPVEERVTGHRGLSAKFINNTRINHACMYTFPENAPPFVWTICINKA